jgi:hypothetical protein
MLVTVIISYFFFLIFLNCILYSCLELGRSVLFLDLLGPTGSRSRCESSCSRRSSGLIGRCYIIRNARKTDTMYISCLHILLFQICIPQHCLGAGNVQYRTQPTRLAMLRPPMLSKPQ